MKSRNNDRSRVMLKVVSFMDCIPGNRKTADGPPILILTFAHQGEIEEPLLLSIADAEKLWLKCTECLAHHDHELANAVFDRFLSGNPDSDDDGPSESWKGA